MGQLSDKSIILGSVEADWVGQAPQANNSLVRRGRRGTGTSVQRKRAARDQGGPKPKALHAVSARHPVSAARFRLSSGSWSGPPTLPVLSGSAGSLLKAGATSTGPSPTLRTQQ